MRIRTFGSWSCLFTDQGVESAVRDACGLCPLLTLVQDACTAITRARH